MTIPAPIYIDYLIDDSEQLMIKDSTPQKEKEAFKKDKRNRTGLFFERGKDFQYGKK